MPRWSLAGAVAMLSSAVAACFLLDTSPPISAARLRVVQRLNRPANVAPFDPVQLAATAGRHWTAVDIEREWTRLGSGASQIYRSPVVASSPPGLFAIVATVPAQLSGAATLLWSTGSVLTEADFARNRQELRAGDATGAIVLRGDTLQSDGSPLQYLFLNVPAGATLGSAISALSVLQWADLARHGPAGPVRATVQHEGRELLLARPGARVSFEIAASAPASVSFGVFVESPVPVKIRVRESGHDGGDTDLFFREVASGEWHDFTVPLRGLGQRELTFEADAAASDALIRWSLPLLLQPEDEPERPNVIVYVVDALRADALGAYGSSDRRSPAIDLLAREGIVFERAYAAASWTKPSVTTLLTSLYPMTHGLGARFYSDPFPSSAWTLQQALGDAGYTTAQFSANPFTAALSNLDRGFDVALMAVDAGGDMGRAAMVHDRLLTWISARHGQRFFAYVHPADMHPPFAVTAATPRESYQAALASLDKEIGALRQRFAALGLEDNALFVLTADHGEAFGEHGREGHGQSVYDEEVRVPLILHWPGRLVPRRVAEPVHHVDLAPTILAAAGLEASGQIQGRSLWPINGTVGPSPVVVTRSVYPEDVDSPIADRSEKHAIVDYPWKLIRSELPDGGRRIELYRLDDDPGERHDRSAAETERVRTLAAAIERLLVEQRAARASFAAQHAQRRAPTAREASRELLERLRSLGYVR